jgi:cbb3-type cytochrome oxidase subunit 3
MDINLMREVVTVASFLAFLSVLAYAAWPANARRFEQAALVPLVDDEPLGPSPQPSPRGEGTNVGQGFANGGHR